MKEGGSDPEADTAPKTLDQKWRENLRNQPVIAAILVAAGVVTGVGAFWDHLPASWRAFPPAVWHGLRHDSTPESGWVIAGYVDPTNDNRWSTDQRLAIVRQSGGAKREFVLRTGDVVQALKPLRQIIVDYKTKRTAHQLQAPWTLKGTINFGEDWTGRVYDKGSKLEVMDVSEGQSLGGDIAVWVRVQPMAKGENE